MNLILGVFLGALLAIGSVVVAEFLRDTVLTPRELEVFTGGRVLASLPSMRRAAISQAREKFVALETVSEPEPAQPKLARPRLSQPKLVHDPLLKWASGE
jgi:hypothetical protein